MPTCQSECLKDCPLLPYWNSLGTQLSEQNRHVCSYKNCYSALKKEDSTVIGKRSEELKRWVKFYQSAADHVCIDDLPDNPTKSSLNPSSDADQYNQEYPVGKNCGCRSVIWQSFKNLWHAAFCISSILAGLPKLCLRTSPMLNCHYLQEQWWRKRL